MKKHRNDARTYTVVPYPKLRRVVALMYPSVQRKPMIHGLIEVDVTRARQYLRERKAQTGETLSFTAFLITCLARAVDENRLMHACRKGKKQLALFDDVDVATLIEREMAGQKQPIVYIIRGANRKSVRAIHDEIRTAQVEAVEHAWEGFEAAIWLERLPMLILRLLWAIFWWARERYPRVQRRYGGTVGISSVGMFGKGAGWGIPVTYQTLAVTVGGIAERSGVVEGQIAIREYLCLTLSMNHDIIDGAPAARFTMRLKELIESGYGLGGEDVAAFEPSAARR